MEEKWTNTSSPLFREMKPYPFAALNHLTVPVSFINVSFVLSSDEISQSRMRGLLREASAYRRVPDDVLRFQELLDNSMKAGDTAELVWGCAGLFGWWTRWETESAAWKGRPT